MTRSTKPLPLRQSDDRSWEVENIPGHWIKCETKKDAEIISNAPIVRAKLDRTMCPNKVLAAELDKAAEILDKYNMRSTARYFRAMAEKAKGEKACWKNDHTQSHL